MVVEKTVPTVASIAEIRTGTYTGDDVNGRDIVTGLTKPIRFLWLLSDVGANSYYAFKSDTMSGRNMALPASTPSDMTVTTGASFTGSDFNVRIDDALTFNTSSGSPAYHWLAVGF